MGGLITSRVRSEASRSMRGTMRHCLSAWRLARFVEPDPALPNVYKNAAVDTDTAR